MQTGPGFVSLPCESRLDVTLSRLMKQAELVYAERQTPLSICCALTDAMASACPTLRFSTQTQVLEDRYGANLNRMVVPKGKIERLAYVSEFVEEAGFGLVRAITSAGWRGAQVAPAANPNAQK
jgi:hypothetical protein